MSKRTKILVTLLLVFTVVIFVSIWYYRVVPIPILIGSCKGFALDEDECVYWQFAIDRIGRVYGTIDLKNWDEHYSLEILLMTMDSFAAYKEGGAYHAWQKSISTRGTWSFEFTNIAPGNYVIVIDNTDGGWKSTDFDFVNDYAVFDFKAYYQPNF